MKFRATNEQMKKILAAAVNASTPAGLGVIHYQDRRYSPDEFSVNDDMGAVSADYIGGRMVKFSASRVKGADDEWRARDTISHEYQSWAAEYISYASLVSRVIGTDAILEDAE